MRSFNSDVLRDATSVFHLWTSPWASTWHVAECKRSTASLRSARYRSSAGTRCAIVLPWRVIAIVSPRSAIRSTLCELRLGLYSLYFASLLYFQPLMSTISILSQRPHEADISRRNSYVGDNRVSQNAYAFDLHLYRIADRDPCGSGAAAWDDVSCVELHACHPLDDRGHLLVTLWGMEGGASIGDAGKG